MKFGKQIIQKKLKPSSIDILDQYKQNEIKKPIEIYKYFRR